MRRNEQKQKDHGDRFETDSEREKRENIEIDSYHQETENRMMSKIYIRTEYLD